MTTDPTAQRRGLRARLNEPVDTNPNPAAQAPGEKPVDPVESRIRRAEARSAANYRRRLRDAEAAENPTALLMAHVDRVRALKDPKLTRDAATAVADLVSRHDQPGQAGAA